MRELRFQLGITNIYIERVGNIGCRLQLASRWLRGTAPVVEPQILVLCNAVTQAERRREIEGILGNVVSDIRAEEVTGFPFLVFEIDAHVEIHLGVDTANGHFTAMGLVAAAGDVAVILIGQRHSERIEVDKKAIFIDIVGIGVGVAVVVAILVDEVEVVVVRQRLHISNARIVGSSRLNVVVVLQAGRVEDAGPVEIQDIVSVSVLFITVGAVIETETEPAARVALEGAAETESSREIIPVRIAPRIGTLVVDAVAVGQLCISISAHGFGITVIFKMRLIESEAGHKLQPRESIDFPAQAQIHPEVMTAVDVLAFAFDK